MGLVSPAGAAAGGVTPTLGAGAAGGGETLSALLGLLLQRLPGSTTYGQFRTFEKCLLYI